MNVEEAITLYYIDKINNITQTKWNKLLFFTDGAGVCIDKQFTNYEYIKLPYGPVPDGYTEKLTKMHYSGIIKKSRLDVVFDSKIFLEKGEKHTKNMDNAIKEIDKDENLKEILNKIVDTFGTWAAVSLSDLSHELDAWKNPPMYSPISLKDLENDYFLKKQFNNPNFGKLLLERD